MSTSMPEVFQSVPRGTICACGAPVELLKAQQCRQCYKKDHPSKRYYDKQRENHPDWAACCQRGEHKKCSGWRNRGGTERCKCGCHLGICPCCHMPSDSKTKARLGIAAARIRQLARELEAGLTGASQ